MPFELCCCTQTLLDEIAMPEIHRRDVAQSYRLAMESSEETDWGASPDYFFHKGGMLNFARYGPSETLYRTPMRGVSARPATSYQAATPSRFTREPLRSTPRARPAPRPARGSGSNASASTTGRPRSPNRS